MLTHENLMTSIHNIAHFERSTHMDRALCFLPLHHGFAQIHITGSSVYAGGCVVIQNTFDLDMAMTLLSDTMLPNFMLFPPSTSVFWQ